MIPDKIHHELLNWARWAWQGEWPHPLPPTHCGSLEANYRAPPDWNPDDPPPPPPIKANERNARVVQAVFDRLPDHGRLVLKAEYPCRREHRGRQDAAAKIGISISIYETVLVESARKVGDAFEIR